MPRPFRSAAPATGLLLAAILLAPPQAVAVPAGPHPGFPAAAAVEVGPAYPGVGASSSAADGFTGDLHRLARPRTLELLALGGALALAGRSVEAPAPMTRRLDVPALDGQADLGNIYGNGAVLGGAALGLMVGGRVAGNGALRSAGGEMARSLILSGAAVWALKLAVNRRRPNGGSHSFPSGHTASAFSVAPVLARRFGWRAGVPAYALAAFTGMGRMEDRRHYLSDVVFGAAVGLAVGEAVSGSGAGAGIASHLSLGPGGAAVTASF